MNIEQRPVLVLNNCYEPMSICSAKRAMKMIVKGIARSEHVHQQKIYSKRMWDTVTGDFIDVDFYLPRVIRLLNYRYIPRTHQTLPSRKNVMNRDRNCCQYCGKYFSGRELTLDHVVPVSRGGKGTWENLVACCKPCNNRKADRLLSEIPDMHLCRQPKPINVHTSRSLLRNLGADDPAWRKYLYYEDPAFNTWSEETA